MNWISILDRLPQIEKNSSIQCLVYTKDNNIFNAWYDANDGTFDILADYESLKDFEQDHDKVTHWCLLRDIPNPNQPERLSEKTEEAHNKGWFSVKDKLPGIKQNLVLVYSKDHGYEIARFIAQSNGYFFCISQDVRQTWEPEFWMPIVSLDAIV